MKLLVAILAALLLSPAYAQHWRGQGHGYGPGPGYGYRGGPRFDAQRQMPPPERRMGWEERQRLREQVRNGQMSREEARQRWREQRAADPERFSREQREQLRRDVMDANRDMYRR
jgi:hypothetical protein